MLNKKGKSEAVTWVIVAAVVVIIVQATGIYDFSNLLGSGTTPSGSSSGGGTSGGVTASTPQVSFNCFDMHNQQTAVSCNVTYLTEGKQGFSKDADGQSIQLSKGDTIEYMVWGNGYYKAHGTYTMPDKNTDTIGIGLLQYDTSPTIRAYNEDDSLLNDATNTEALGANANDDVEIEIISSHKDGIMGAHFYVAYDKTNMDDVTSTLGNDVPEPDSLTYNTSSVAGISTQASEFRVWPMGNLNADPSTPKQTKNFYVTFDVSGTAYGTQNVTLGILDQDWYQDQNGGFSYGFEEPVDNVDQAQLNHEFDAGFFTASS